MGRRLNYKLINFILILLIFLLNLFKRDEIGRGIKI